MLWVSFIATLILTLCFGLIMHIWEFGIIDEMYKAEQITRHIDAMTDRQKSVHAIMTASLDVLYPLSYGAFFIGVALRYGGRFGLWLAAPSLLCIPADLLEGLSQVMLLTGHGHYMGLKLFATPMKLALFVSGLLITIILLSRLAFRRFQSSRS